MILAAKPDVVLMDVFLPRMSGVECTARLKAAHPDLLIVMLTACDEDEILFLALESGADGYLLKRTSPDALRAAMLDVLAGQKSIQIGVRPAASPPRPELLSLRELEVLRLMRLGTTNLEIGRKLGIAERTVKSHVTAILVKLNASDRAGAVARGFDLGLLKIDPEAASPANG